jgi:hypothetical protein
MAVWGGEFWVIPQLRDFALDALLERTPVQIRSGHGVLGVYKFLGFFRIWVFQPSVGVRNLKKKMRIKICYRVEFPRTYFGPKVVVFHGFISSSFWVFERHISLCTSNRNAPTVKAKFVLKTSTENLR